MRTLKQLLGLCEHKWNLHSITPLNFRGVRSGVIRHLQCEKCGDFKDKEY